MNKALFHYRIRRLHRFLGVSIGLQFIAWTFSGLWFSFSNMDEIHGDYEKAPPALVAPSGIVSPAAALESLKTTASLDSLLDLRLVSILGKPFWQVSFFEKGQGAGPKKIRLAEAATGSLRPPLTEAEAVEVAKQGFLGKKPVKSVVLLTKTSDDHEYRESPLPAYAVTFDNERQTTVYVSPELGTVQKFRNRPWRRFDFLWMLHTMDYRSRDNISNWLLRVFSIFGLATVLSGFVLFFVSRKRRTA